MPLPKKKSLRPATASPEQVPATPAAAADQLTPAAQLSGPAELQWSYNPWLDSRSRGWKRPQVALALLLMCCLIAAWSLAEQRTWPELLAWTLTGLLLSMGMCATLFLPVYYRLDNRGVTVTFLLAPSFRPWEHYRNFYVHDTGIHVTTMPQPSPLDAFRGHYLQYGRGAGRRELVEAFITQRIRRETPAQAQK